MPSLLSREVHTHTVRRLTTVLFPLAFAAIAWVPRVDAMPCTRAMAAEKEKTDRSLYFAMWTIHLQDRVIKVQTNNLVAVSWGHVYAATFVNSFDKRSYAAGIQKMPKHWNARFGCLAAGYRMGLVTGYDRRFVAIADRVPVLPFIQPLLSLQIRRFGMELSYSGVVVSAALNIRLSS